MSLLVNRFVPVRSLKLNRKYRINVRLRRIVRLFLVFACFRLRLLKLRRFIRRFPLFTRGVVMIVFRVCRCRRRRLRF